MRKRERGASHSRSGSPEAPGERDPLFVFKQGATERYERANEHVRYEPDPPVLDLIRLSRLLRQRDEESGKA